jgi:hypothetical protein
MTCSLFDLEWASAIRSKSLLLLLLPPPPPSS